MNAVPHIVRLAEGDLLKAKEWERRVLALMGAGAQDAAKNPDGISRDDRFMIGYVGEIAVASTLRHFGIAYIHRVNLTGKTGPPEFLVSNGHHVTIEVKTRGAPQNDLMLVNKAQLGRNGVADYFIGTRIEQLHDTFADVSVWGYLTGEEVQQLDTRDDIGGQMAHFKPLATLRPLAELMGKLTSVQQIVHGLPA